MPRADMVVRMTAPDRHPGCTTRAIPRGVRAVALAMATAGALACATAAHAQADRYEKFERLDPMVGDSSSLSMSLRMMPLDLSPHGFRNIFKVPGHDDLLMRMDGALYAIFDYSVYARDPNQKKVIAMRPIVPAATVYYIGKPNFKMIRGTGLRDISFRREDPIISMAPPQALVSTVGVERMVAVPIDGGTSQLQTRIEGRVTGKEPRRETPDEDISYPPVPRLAERAAAPPPVVRAAAPAPVAEPAADSPQERAAPKAAAPDASDAPAAPDAPNAPNAPGTRAAPASPAATPRADRPGFQQRIDELMRRAKKAQ